jgi:hypothetical protein
MAFDNEDVEPGVEEEAGPPPEESSNRPFIIVAAILGGIMLLSLLCVAGYALFVLPRRGDLRASYTSTAIAQQTAIALSAQQTKEANAIPPTWTKAPPTPTTPPTRTPVVAAGGTATPTISAEDRQATIAAMLTEAAVTAGAKSPTPTSATLPVGGIFDDWNPGLIIGLSLVLVAVIIVARRLRSV